MPVTDRGTGEIRDAQIFVAVLGASNYTYAEATWSQALPDWIGSHVRAFAFLGVVPELVVPDNLRSGVSNAHRYEPDINPTYQDMATHYGVTVLPARARKPRDKAKVEKRRAGGRALDPGRLAPPPVLLPDGTELDDRRAVGEAQYPSLPEVVRMPPRLLRATGPAGHAALAGAALRLRRVEAGPGPHRLPRGH